MAINPVAQIPMLPSSGALVDSSQRITAPWSLFFTNLVSTVKGLVSSVSNLQQNVAFSVWQSVTQTLVAATITKVNFQTKEFDLTSAFDTTLMRYTPKVAGYYSITSGVYVQTATSGLLYLYKNAGVYKYGEYVGTNEYISTLSCLVYLNGTTDYVELYVYSAVANTISIGQPGCWFQGVLVARA
jgi:hypothetical protein